MAFESIKAKIELFLKKYILITEKINAKPQQCISPAGSCIAECLQIHQPAKGRIKKINNGQNKIPGTMNMSSH